MAAGEAGSGQWVEVEVEVEVDGSGMVLSMGWLRDKLGLGRFDGKASGVEVWAVGLTSGEDISPVERFGVVDDVPTAGLTDDCSCRVRRFPSNEPLTERDGAKGERAGVLAVDVVASDITASSS